MALAASFLLAGTFPASAIPTPIAAQVSPDPLGTSWEQTLTAGLFNNYCVEPVGEHSVTIWFDDGSSSAFDLSVTPECQLVQPIDFVNPVFTLQSGAPATLTDPSAPTLEYLGSIPGQGELLDPNTFLDYAPVLFVYTIGDQSVQIDTSELPTTPPAVPEPSTLAMFGAALGLLSLLRRVTSGLHRATKTLLS